MATLDHRIKASNRLAQKAQRWAVAGVVLALISLILSTARILGWGA